MKTIKFYTLGCKVNQYDTQSIREGFIRKGYKELEDGKPADVYVINTCTVTHRADTESLNLIRRARRENPKARIIVTGCLTELDEDKIKQQGRINSIIKNKDKDKRGISNFKGHCRAFLKIQDGCNNFCSFCKVPLVRGPSRSRPLARIVKEAAKLVKNGFKEIVLCGICLGAYGRDLKPKISIVDVIDRLEEIPGLLRLRLSSIEAGDLTDELISKISGSKKLCKHLHIPLQSGDDQILEKMNRHYSSKDYLSTVSRIRKIIPQIAITTDVLVGFPGEKENNFQNTLRLIKKIRPLKTHIFPFSAREGTAASNFGDLVERPVIKERIALLKAAAEESSLIYRSRFLNKTLEALIEEEVSTQKGYWQGYTDNYIKVWVKSRRNLRGKLIPVQLKNVSKAIIKCQALL